MAALLAVSAAAPVDNELQLDEQKRRKWIIAPFRAFNNRTVVRLYSDVLPLILAHVCTVIQVLAQLSR